MATITTPGADQAWRPDIHVFAPADVLPDALYLSATLHSGNVEGDAPSVRVAFVKDADSAAFVAEGAEISEDDPDLDEVVVHTRKLARLIRISREQYGQSGTAARLARSVSRDIVRQADRALLTQVAPTAPAVAPAVGLYGTSGLINAGEVEDNLDLLVDTLAVLQANESRPSLLIVDPVGFARLAKLKESSSSNRSLLTPDATSGASTVIAGIRTVVSNALAAGTGLIVDPSAIASAYGQLTIATSEHAYFNSDTIAIRATWRVGHQVVYANRLARFTVADPDA